MKIIKKERNYPFFFYLSLATRVEKISEQVEASVIANGEVVDSVSNLSATSEEVAASSESGLSLAEDCVEKMKETTEVLDEILNLANSL